MKLLVLLLLVSFTALSADSGLAMQMLTAAARSGDVKTAESLLSSGADPNLPSRSGGSPLYYAALFNRADVAALLLAHDADPNTTNSGEPLRSKFPQTPLQVAASIGNMEMALMLIRAGAHVNAASGVGRTALHFAVVGSHLDMSRMLIQKGAEVNARDSDGTSALDDAVWRGYLDEAAVLIAHGARLNEAETKTGATPINEAAFRGQAQIVRYLLQLDAKVDVADRQGHTPLENAIRMRHAHTAVMLLEARGPSKRSYSALPGLLKMAIDKREAAVVEALVRGGADTNGPLLDGATPLITAASTGAVDVVRVLLSAGADPNRSGQNGTSPLEEASVRGHSDVVEVLINAGSKVNQINGGSGTTALYAAASFGKGDVVRLLLRSGADVNLCGKGSRTPYQAALENGFREVAAAIQRQGGGVGCKR